MTVEKMYVVKRSGQHEAVCFDKITARIARLADGLDVDAAVVTQKVINYLHSGISTEELDRLTAETAAYMSADQPDYRVLAARVLVSNLHKQTAAAWADVVAQLSYVTTHGRRVQVLSDAFTAAVAQHGCALQAALDYDRDYLFDYFGFKTLERSYLLRVNGVVVERPQHMYMRVALGMQLAQGGAAVDVAEVVATYHALSTHTYTHASPTMFNAGTRLPQLASCFLLPVDDDSIVGIYDTIKKCAVISKNAGGIGVSIHNVRAAGSLIAGTSGTSNGLTPMLRVFNDTARYVDQCFPGTTRVHGPRGPVAIKDIAVDDAVLTSDATYGRVARLLRHDRVDAPLCELMLYGAAQPLHVTEQHPLMVVRHSPNVLASLKTGTRRPEYLDMPDIRKGDYAVFVVPAGAPQDLTDDQCAFLGACALATVHPGAAAHFRLALRHTAIELATMAAAVAVDVAMDMDGGVLEATAELPPALAERAALPFLPLSEAQHLHYLTGMLRLCAVEARPVVLEVKIPHHTPAAADVARRLQHHALGCAHVAFVDGDTVRVVWSAPLKAWWDGFYYHAVHAACGVMITDTVQRWGDKLLVPIVGLNMAAPATKAPLYDMELAGEPHDYTTEYGVVHNGGGKRKGAIAVYLEPWHADVLEFLELKKNTGKEEARARDLFYALWIPDLFMRRVRDDADWSLFCPDQIAPVRLHELHSAAFDAAYERLEAEGRAHSVVKARAVWGRMVDSQMETGTPYLLFKDACNAKSNQQNLGTIKSSNLCTEIIEYSAPDEIAVCNLASIALPRFVRDGAFDYAALMDTVALATRNLNRVIDASYYPLPEMARSNLAHRPVGLGVQGLADVFFLLGVPFTSPAARDLNRRIFKCLYYAAVAESARLARAQHDAQVARGLQPDPWVGAYASFAGSPASQGRLQPDLWGVDPAAQDGDLGLDWDGLRAAVARHGMTNSLLVAPMPTASTAQIMGNVECFEPQTSNLFTRMVLSGNFIVVNKHLVAELARRGMWTEAVRARIIADDGSVQGLDIPAEVKEVFRTVWEIKQRDIVDMAADRAPYIDQSQSLNIHIAQPTHAQLTALHFYTWERGLKTGMYYLRTRPAATPIKASLGAGAVARAQPVCTDEVCTMCSS